MDGVKRAVNEVFDNVTVLPGTCVWVTTASNAKRAAMKQNIGGHVIMSEDGSMVDEKNLDAIRLLTKLVEERDRDRAKRVICLSSDRGEYDVAVAQGLESGGTVYHISDMDDDQAKMFKKNCVGYNGRKVKVIRKDQHVAATTMDKQEADIVIVDTPEQLKDWYQHCSGYMVMTSYGPDMDDMALQVAGEDSTVSRLGDTDLHVLEVVSK